MVWLVNASHGMMCWARLHFFYQTSQHCVPEPTVQAQQLNVICQSMSSVCLQTEKQELFLLTPFTIIWPLESLCFCAPNSQYTICAHVNCKLAKSRRTDCVCVCVFVFSLTSDWTQSADPVLRLIFCRYSQPSLLKPVTGFNIVSEYCWISVESFLKFHIFNLGSNIFASSPTNSLMVRHHHILKIL